MYRLFLAVFLATLSLGTAYATGQRPPQGGPVAVTASPVAVASPVISVNPVAGAVAGAAAKAVGGAGGHGGAGGIGVGGAGGSVGNITSSPSVDISMRGNRVYAVAAPALMGAASGACVGESETLSLGAFIATVGGGRTKLDPFCTNRENARSLFLAAQEIGQFDPAEAARLRTMAVGILMKTADTAMQQLHEATAQAQQAARVIAQAQGRGSCPVPAAFVTSQDRQMYPGC